MTHAEYFNNLKQDILKRNKSYIKKSKQRRRIDIAKEVIAMLNVEGVFNPIHNEYCNIAVPYKEVRKRMSDTPSTQETMIDIVDQHYCEGCAQAALFIAKTLKFNHAYYPFTMTDIFADTKGTKHDESENVCKTFGVHLNGYDLVDGLSDAFDTVPLILIEAAYEGRLIHDTYLDKMGVSHSMKPHQKQVRQAIGAFSKYTDPKDRLIAICQNIIDNKGEFMP